jgi:CDP-glucose 4,6-dehydratase
MVAELRKAYGGKRVFLTGHTGFKGGWLALWLRELGASVTGYALPPDTTPSLFEAAGVGEAVRHLEGDVRDLAHLRRALAEVEPDFVFHLAAQSLVRRSYDDPLTTIQTNVLGTAHVLEALRLARGPCAAVIVTSDKCYENRGWVYGYREDDALGGHDVYSMSKGAAELVTASYRRSFFPPETLDTHGVAIASARAGNVIGGGDWCVDRILPDAVKALAEGRPVPVRNPRSVRPWQHVLEPLGGYLLLGARLAGPDRADFCSAWNFGPRLEDAQPVQRVVELLIERWGEGRWEDRHDPREPHEAKFLRLSCEKAHAQLGWRPRWDLRQAIDKAADWYRMYYRERPLHGMREVCAQQLRAYEKSVDGG